MALARPLTKAQQAADSARSQRPGPSDQTDRLTLGTALDRWYVHLQASERIKSEATIRAYRYGVGFLVEPTILGR